MIYGVSDGNGVSDCNGVSDDIWNLIFNTKKKIFHKKNIHLTIK